MEFAFTPGAGGAAPRGALVPRGEPGRAARGAARARLARRLGPRGPRRRRALVRRRGDPVRGGRPRALLRPVPDDRRRPPRSARGGRTTRGRSRSTGSCPHLDTVDQVLREDMTAVSAEGETLATVDETRPLGKLVVQEHKVSLDGDFEAVRLRLLAALAVEAVGVAQKALELGVEYVSDARAVREEDRHLPGRLAPARRHLRRDRARPLARLLGRLVRLRSTTSRRRSPSPPRRRRRPRPPSPPASGRSRCTAASASPGSTSCTATTSARSGSTRSAATPPTQREVVAAHLLD